MTQPSKVRSATLVYITLSMLQRGLAFLLLPFVSRALSPAEFGAVTVLVAVTTFPAVVLGGALEPLVFRSAARDPDDHSGVLNLCQWYLYLVLPILAILAAALMLIVGGEPMGISSRAWAIELIAVGLTTATTSLAISLLRAREHFRRFVTVTVATIVGALIGKIVLVVILDMGVIGWAVSDLVIATMGYVAGVTLAHVKPQRIRLAALASSTRFTAPMVPHRIAFWALVTLDKPLLAYVGSLHAVGVYALASTISQATSTLLAEFSRATLVDYARAEFPAPTGGLARITRTQVLAALVIPAVVAAVMAISHPLIVGPKFGDAVPLLSVLLLGQVCYGIYVIPSSFSIQTAGVPGLNWMASAVGAAIIAAGTLIFGPTYGAWAIAWASVAGYLAMTLGTLAICRAQRLAIVWGAVRPRSIPLLAATVALGAGCISTLTSGASQAVIAVAAIALAALAALTHARSEGLLKAITRPRKTSR